MDLRYVDIRFTELKQQVGNWVKKTYNKADVVLSAADPYGQILQAVEMVFQTTTLYIKNIVAQFDITNPNNKNAKMITFTARLAGYNPSRAMSATGTLTIQLRPGVDISEEIAGAAITMRNNLQFTNNTNNLYYYLDLGGKEDVTYNITPNKKYYLPMVQGRLETQVYTGTGRNIQTLSVSVPSSAKIENFRVSVYVDDQYYSLKDSLYDMLPNEYACIMRTGLSGGIDLTFGTGNYGFVPLLGSRIQVKYVLSDGAAGNIPHKQIDDWKLVDEVFDVSGNPIELPDLFNIEIYDEIGMGGDGESVEFTRAAIPHTSRNFVLSKPENYEFHLKRLGVFSQVNAYAGTKKINGTEVEDSVVYLFLVPDIGAFIGTGASYFDLDLDAFYLDDLEKKKVESYLKTQGILSTGTSMKVVDPSIKKYVVNIFLEIYSDTNEENVTSAIQHALSDYFTNATRSGRIPKSDLIRIIAGINGVNSVDVKFDSEANEAYHKKFEDYKHALMVSNPLLNPATIRMNGYDPNAVLGLDQRLGDILFDKHELPVIRGGWSTRSGYTYNERITNKGLGSVNIQIDSTKNNRKQKY